MFRFVDENGVEQFRKPNQVQRKKILIYYLRRRSGRMMMVKGIADDFHVSERTMQKLLKELETEGIIRRDPVYDDKACKKPIRSSISERKND